MNRQTSVPSSARARAQERHQQREVQAELDAADARDAELNKSLEEMRAVYPNATVRPNWKMPSRVCCGMAAHPVALLDGGEAILFFECESCGNTDVEIDWPFNELRARTENFESIGFRIE
jgi:hypothetical protein